MGEHYYGKGGEERYDAGMREVRKEHLLPSVTTILNIKNKPGLQFWKQNKIYDAMYDWSCDYVGDCAPLYNMTADRAEVVKTVKAALKVEMNKSAEAGAEIHRWVEAWTKGEGDAFDEVPPELSVALHNFFYQNKIEPIDVEHSFANYDLGYGGKIDLDCEMDGKFTIIDWKTKDTKGKTKTQLFSEVPMQLAACANGVWKPDAQLATVIISRDEPGRIDPPQIWKNNEKHYKAFQSALNLWCHEKNYNPWTGGKWFE